MINIIVSSGGVEWIEGGTDSGAQINSGGFQQVFSGASAVDTTLSRSLSE
jgi:autotransporter passenger strand-loop-strand repeat protein